MWSLQKRVTKEHHDMNCKYSRVEVPILDKDYCSNKLHYILQQESKLTIQL